MPRFLYAGIVWTLWATSGAAQPHLQVRAGLHLAGVATNAALSPDQTLDQRLGGTVAVAGVVPLGAGLDLQPEVSYAPRGYTTTFDASNQHATGVADYVDTAVLLRYTYLLDRTRSVAVFAGPSVGVKVYEALVRRVDGDRIVRRTTSLTRYDAGLTAGAGMTSGRFLLDLRYTHGLTDIDANTVNAVSIHNRAFAVTLGYRLF